MTLYERLRWSYSIEGLDGYERAVLLCIAFHASEYKLGAYPSVDRIARETAFERKTVMRARDRLVARGVLSVERSRGRNPIRYRLVVQATLETGGQPSLSGTVEPSPAGTVENPNRPPHGHEPSLSGTSTVPPRYPNQQGTIQEPTNPRAITQRQRSGNQQTYPPEFERAWTFYPRREGGNAKADAIGPWNARIREGVSAEEMTAGVRRYAEYVRAKGTEGTQYVMQAKRFFGPGQQWAEAWTAEQRTTGPAEDYLLDMAGP